MPTLESTPAPAIPDISVPFVDRNRVLTPQWYPWILKLLQQLIAVAANVQTVNTATDGLTSSVTTIQGTVEGITTTITETASVINGIESHWGVQIDNHGVVNGLIRLDSDASGSTFSVQADKFLIALPTDTTHTITAFIAGLVNGVPTVGINGNLIVDQTITANSLSVSTLSAITANLGTVTAGLMESADGKFVIDLTNKIIDITT
jgi:hypothetical protein